MITRTAKITFPRLLKVANNLKLQRKCVIEMLYYLRMPHAWQQSIKICTTCKAVIILHILVVPHSCGQSEQEASTEQSIKIHFNYHFEQRQNRKVSTQAQLLLFVSPDISLISADSC